MSSAAGAVALCLILVAAVPAARGQTSQAAGAPAGSSGATSRPGRTLPDERTGAGAATHPSTAPAGLVGPPGQVEPTSRGASPARGGGGLWGKPSEVDPFEAFWSVLASVVVVLLLGAAGIFVARKVLPRLRASSGRRLAVMESIYLGPRQTVHLLRVGTRRFLLASTRERISMLAELPEEAEPAPEDRDGRP